MKCPHCGYIHTPDGGLCPRVKAIEYYPDGSVKRVEFVEQPMVGHPASPFQVIGVPLGTTWGCADRHLLPWNGPL